MTREKITCYIFDKSKLIITLAYDWIDWAGWGGVFWGNFIWGTPGWGG